MVLLKGGEKMFIAANLLASAISPQVKGTIRTEINSSSSFQQQLLGASDNALNQSEGSNLSEGLDKETLNQLKDYLKENQNVLEQLQTLLDKLNVDSEISMESLEFSDEQLAFLEDNAALTIEKLDENFDPEQLKVLTDIISELDQYGKENDVWMSQLRMGIPNISQNENDQTDKINSLVKQVVIR